MADIKAGKLAASTSNLAAVRGLAGAPQNGISSLVQRRPPGLQWRLAIDGDADTAYASPQQAAQRQRGGL